MDFLEQILWMAHPRRLKQLAVLGVLAVTWLAVMPYCFAPSSSSQFARHPASVEQNEGAMEEVDAIRPLKVEQTEILEDNHPVLSIRQVRQLNQLAVDEPWNVAQTLWILCPIIFLILGGGIFSLAAHTGMAQNRKLAKPGIGQIIIVSLKFLVLASFAVTVIGGMWLLLFSLLYQWWDVAWMAGLVSGGVLVGLAIWGLRYLLAIWYVFCEEFKLGQALRPQKWQEFIAAFPPKFAWAWLVKWAISTAEILLVVIIASALLSGILMLLGAFGVGGLMVSWAKYAQYIYLLCFGTYLVMFVGQAFYLGHTMRQLKQAFPKQTNTLSLTPSDLA